MITKGLESTQQKISKVFDGMKDLVIYKNQKYGDSALNPNHVFFKGEAEDSIKIRLDDKIGRIRSSDELRKNDVSDLIGYLSLLCVKKGWVDFSEFKD